MLPCNFGLFSKISGYYRGNVNIISAKIITRSDGLQLIILCFKQNGDGNFKKNIQQKNFKRLKDELKEFMTLKLS